mmetsp:Transcript_7894/g.13843  ORF Transcript_7894/g.13843 Transcript_7894/m.13843 type:complete len:207 (+) Transcript_7894:1278-1898(+)
MDTFELLVDALECHVPLLALVVHQLSNRIHALGDLAPLAGCHLALRIEGTESLLLDVVDEAFGLLLMLLHLGLGVGHLPADGTHLRMYDRQLVPHQFPLHLRQLLAAVLDVVDGSVCQCSIQGSQALGNSIVDIAIGRQCHPAHVVEGEALTLHLQNRLQGALQITETVGILHVYLHVRAHCIDHQLFTSRKRLGTNGDQGVHIHT